LFGAEKGKCSR